MTLVAGLSVGGLPAFIGDLLLSWRLKTEIDLPTVWHPGIYPGQDGDHASGLAQKLVIVRAYMMVAWAGSYSEATRIIKALDQTLPPTLNQLTNPAPILDILDTCSEGTELVALLIWEKTIQPIGVRTQGFELDGKRIYLLGSGAPEFFSFLEMHPEAFPEADSADGLVARATMLRFAARALTMQLKLGTGLESSWGGGFEIVYPHQSIGFTKLDKLLFRAWMIDESGAYHNSGRSFFATYYGANLHLSWFNPDEHTYVVPSLVGPLIAPPEHEILHPEWTMDVFLMKEHGSFFEFARYHPPHRPTADAFEISHGNLVGWEMDKEYVEACAKQAIEQAPKGATFSMVRY